MLPDRGAGSAKSRSGMEISCFISLIDMSYLPEDFNLLLDEEANDYCTFTRLIPSASHEGDECGLCQG
jgi:hypothetical protein